jgi:hypothetical protein
MMILLNKSWKEQKWKLSDMQLNSTLIELETISDRIYHISSVLSALGVVKISLYTRRRTSNRGRNIYKY